MAVRKRGSIWYYDFTIKKIRYRGSISEAQNKQEALRAESKVRTSVFEGKYGKPSGEAQFMEYADKTYLPWAKENKLSFESDYYKVTSMFKEFFGKLCFKQITPMVIERYKRQRMAKPIERTEGGKTIFIERKPSSVNRELALLSKIFSMAIRDGLTEINPCEKVKRYREDNKRTRYLSLEEEKNLLERLTAERAHIRPIVVLAIYTGMRRGEIFNLKWSDVDFARSYIHIGKSKTGRARFIPMTEIVRDELEQLRAGAKQDAEHIFILPRTGKPLTRIDKSFTGACKDAGIRNLRFHDLRHTTGTRLGEIGTDVFTIAEILGHSDIRMTARYTHATDNNLRKAAQGLENYGKKENVTNLSQKRKTG
jgi:integrase